MLDKKNLNLFNKALLGLINNRCQVESLQELTEDHIPLLSNAFERMLCYSTEAIADEWGIQQDWLEHIINFSHNFDDHIHSEINPFGLKLLKDSEYLISPHLHIGDKIIGGDNISGVLYEIAVSLAAGHTDYVMSRHVDKTWQKILEAITMHSGKLVLNNDWTETVKSNEIKMNTASNAVVEAETIEEDGTKKYNPARLNKYDKPIDNANVGEIMGALGEALDEVLNRRDIKPIDKEIRGFLGVGAADMSNGEKSFPGFYIPMAIMGMEAILNNLFNVIKTTNYNWGGQIKPVGFGMYQIGLDTEKKLMHAACQFCELKSDPSRKMVITRKIEQTMSGPELMLECITPLKDADLYNMFFAEVKAWIKENNYYKGKKIDAKGKFLNVSSYSWDDIILEPEAKDNIFDDVVGFLNHEALYQINGLPFKRGLVLYGKPGCGKTLLGKVVANQVASSFIWITAAQASSASFIRSLFELAREIAPCILFFEDIDMYTVDRGYGAFNSMVGEMLAQMDGMEENNGLIIIATTNRLDVIEKALAERPSRFDRRYSLDYLSPETTELMVSRKLGNAVLQNVTVPEIGKMVFGLNGCFIQEVIVSAKRKAIARGSIAEGGLVILDKELLEESTREVIDAFNITINKLRNGELKVDSGWGASNAQETPDVPVMFSKDQSESEASVVKMATVRMPRNVNLTHPEKDEIDTETKDALAALAKFSEHEDKSEIADYTDEERLDDHAVAVTGSVFDEIEWDKLAKPELRKMFRLMVIRHNVVKIAGIGKDPLKDRKMLGKVLHALDMLSDRYYWVHAFARICTEFGLKIEIPFNPYRDQTSKDAALKLYDMLTGKVKTAKKREDEINKKNNVFVPVEQDYDMPDFKHNSPKIDNINMPELMRK